MDIFDIVRTVMISIRPPRMPEETPDTNEETPEMTDELPDEYLETKDITVHICTNQPFTQEKCYKMVTMCAVLPGMLRTPLDTVKSQLYSRYVSGRIDPTLVIRLEDCNCIQLFVGSTAYSTDTDEQVVADNRDLLSFLARHYGTGAYKISLRMRPSVIDSVLPDVDELLTEFVRIAFNG
jgi:hypothetical protein